MSGMSIGMRVHDKIRRYSSTLQGRQQYDKTSK
jgi:hypothetical protein